MPQGAIPLSQLYGVAETFVLDVDELFDSLGTDALSGAGWCEVIVGWPRKIYFDLDFKKPDTMKEGRELAHKVLVFLFCAMELNVVDISYCETEYQDKHYSAHIVINRMIKKEPMLEMLWYMKNTMEARIFGKESRAEIDSKVYNDIQCWRLITQGKPETPTAVKKSVAFDFGEIHIPFYKYHIRELVMSLVGQLNYAQDIKWNYGYDMFALAKPRVVVRSSGPSGDTKDEERMEWIIQKYYKPVRDGALVMKENGQWVGCEYETRLSRRGCSYCKQHHREHGDNSEGKGHGNGAYLHYQPHVCLRVQCCADNQNEKTNPWMLTSVDLLIVEDLADVALNFKSKSRFFEHASCEDEEDTTKPDDISEDGDESVLEDNIVDEKDEYLWGPYSQEKLTQLIQEENLATLSEEVVYLVHSWKQCLLFRDSSTGYQWRDDTKLWEKVTLNDLAFDVMELMRNYYRSVSQDILHLLRVDHHAFYSISYDNLNKRIARRQSTYNNDTNIAVSVLRLAVPSFVDKNRAGKLDMIHHLAPTNDGKVVDLRTGQARDRIPEDYFTKCFNARLVDGTLDFVERFFRSSMGLVDKDNKPRTDLSEEILLERERNLFVLQAQLGYCMTGETFGRCYFFWYGAKNNSKSTTLKAMQAMMGDFSGLLQGSALQESRNPSPNQHNTHMMPFTQYRLVWIDEMVQSYLSQSTVKSVASGGPEAIRRAYDSTIINYQKIAKLVLPANQPFAWRGDAAMEERTAGTVFPVCFVSNPDPRNKDQYPADSRIEKQMQTQESLNQLFTWCLRGSMEMYEKVDNGDPHWLQREACSREIMSELKVEEDIVDQFMRLYLANKDGSVIQAQLYKLFKEWRGSVWVPKDQSALSARMLGAYGKPYKSGSVMKYRNVTLTEYGAGRLELLEKKAESPP